MPVADDRYREWVGALERFGHRGSATRHEHHAADYLLDELRQSGVDAQKQPFRGSRSLGARLLAHVLVAVAGAALLWAAPVATVLLAAVALISLFAENTTRFVLL